ncbi:cystathionine gamma-synthase [Thalassotalea agarivorans]|uniref:L-methionine gamma-lyase n=1 Tax=Thalassotalea agarivorans TaxID=349064 RepID=A0A1I0CG24_THASX|nr:cystathionine gamma-synthase [Thalassotalea agarivorans]SET18551.1 cystathionine gamma-synthase [Thalassotalea agarivorans]
MTDKKFATQAVRAGINSDEHHKAVVAPLHLSSTYALNGFNDKGAFDYSRTGNPTRALFADALAQLEGGSVGIVTATGMAAAHVIVQTLTKDDLLVIPHDCYGGSYRLYTHLAAKGQFKLKVVDQTNDQAFAEAMALKPTLTLVETPSNPLLRLVDIKRIVEQAKAVGSLVAVDNTFLSPVLQQPLALGADIVFHSTTKFINGHSDMVGGAVITKDKALGETLAWWANCIGVTGSAFDSYLAMRGLKTLPLRIKQHQQNANAVAQYLADHPAVAHVYYPGLASHPDHELAKQQQKDFGSMMSFELVGGVDAVKKLFDGLSLFTLAQSLGGVESLISHPSTMTHAGMELDAQKAAGIGQNLVRLSVGIEDIDDILADLEQGLAASQS